MRTHYDNLKVLETATRDDIKASYRKLCLKYHPDRNPGNAEAERIMRIINDAYDVLSDPVKRHAYDQELVLRRARESQPRNPSSSSTTRHETWPPYRETRTRSHRRPGQSYQGPSRPAGGWYRKWETEQRRPGSGGTDQTAMRVLICVAIVAFCTLFSEHHSTLRFGSPTSAMPAGNFFESRPPLRNASPRDPNLVSPASSSHSPKSPKTGTNPTSARPPKAPNGAPWPENAGYIMGYPLASIAGESRVTLDNTGNNDDVFAKLTSLKNGAQVRTCYVPAHAAFTLMSLTPGEYDLRFRNLATGRMYKTRAFSMKEVGTGLGIEYTTLSLRLTRSGSDSLDAAEVSEQEF